MTRVASDADALAAASSLGVSGPWRSIVASAAACEGLSSSRLLAQAPGGARDDEAQPDGEIGLGACSHW
jgi:hypothetical protein